ncbi:hypothetical protein TNCV_4580201 [Trichonephila clavipes]|nr:hypothetical protein TNCV_4580201 [Trichonephila clavipes]
MAGGAELRMKKLVGYLSFEMRLAFVTCGQLLRHDEAAGKDALNALESGAMKHKAKLSSGARDSEKVGSPLTTTTHQNASVNFTKEQLGAKSASSFGQVSSIKIVWLQRSVKT